jgi:hypothetical protein
MTDIRFLRARQATWSALVDRHPWLRWLARWGLSLASLVTGIATIVLFRRGPDYFPWVLGYLLLLWVGGVVFAHVRQLLEVRHHRLIGVVVDYTIQGLHQDLLIFLLPLYYASTTISSRNVVFLLLLLGAAVLTSIDPWYQATVLKRRWMAQVLFAFGLFSSMNIGLPLIRVRSSPALLLSAFLSVLALTPTIRRRHGLSWRRATLWTAAGALLASILVWSVRDWIPPGPLHLSAATFARGVQDLSPVEPVRAVSATDIQGWGGLVCFTAVSAPAGLREPIYHVWKHDGVPLSRIALSPIRGGRPGGYRTYSKRSDLGPDPAGTWTVDVLTTNGQLIGRVRLVVTR